MGAGGSCSKKNEPDTVPDTKLIGISCGTIDSFKENEIREVKVNDTFSVLVSEFGGKYYAYGSKCPHYGAPLSKGAVMDGIIKCPWHGAAFDIRSGDIEDYPGTGDCIPVYDVVEGNNGELTVFPCNNGVYKIQRPLIPTKDRTKLTVCIGGGPTSLSFAQTMRENHYEGRILIIAKDSFLPYDRTKLSKALGSTWPDIKLKDEKWFADAQVEIMLNTVCNSIDMEKKEISILDRDDKIKFNQVLLATGIRPRLPDENANGVEGVGSKNVMTLCNLGDAAKIKEKAKDRNVIIQGSGFIAMELISTLSPLVKSVKIISRQKLPYGTMFGDVAGSAVQKLLLSKYKNFEFCGGHTIKKIISNEEGEVIKVLTDKETEFPCDLVIYAIGGIPNTEFLQHIVQSELKNKNGENVKLDMSSAGYVTVNKYLETGIEGMWAAGDIVRFPLDIATKGLANCGHWGMSQKMGKIAALNMQGKKHSISTTIPFFWTNVGGINIRYAGYGDGYNETLVFGNPEALKFCIVFKRDSKYLAVLTCNCDPIAAQMSFDLQEGIDYSESYPSCIVEQFPDPPVTSSDYLANKEIVESKGVEVPLNKE